MEITDLWLRDLPQQFQSRKNIEILVSAFGKQLQEVKNVLAQINDDTDIDTAKAANLDMVGNIVSLTRKEATTILREVQDTSVSDDVYRKVLKYKRLKNTSECTYEDIMEAISLIWDVNKVVYVEDPERPATILLKLPPTDLDSPDPAAERVLAIKPAGVRLLYPISYSTVIYIIEKITVPQISMRWVFNYWSSKRFDGTWLLDGSVKFSSYSIPLGFGIVMGAYKAKIAEKIDTSWELAIKEVMQDRAYLKSVDIGMKFPFFDIHFFNGRWKLDGKYRLGAYTIPMRTGLDLMVPSKTSEKIDTSIVLKKNYWCLDGAYSFDGAKILNAEIKEEVL